MAQPTLNPLIPSFCSIVETQLKKHVLDATSRWGFDFSADQPIRSPEAKYVWERVPPLDDDQEVLSSSRSSSSGPGPVMTLSSAAHVRTIEVMALSPSSTSSTLSSANSSLCNSDLEMELDVSGGVRSPGDLKGVEGNSNDGAAAKRMVQKKMTGEWPFMVIKVRGEVLTCGRVGFCWQ